MCVHVIFRSRHFVWCYVAIVLVRWFWAIVFSPPASPSWSLTRPFCLSPKFLTGRGTRLRILSKVHLFWTDVLRISSSGSAWPDIVQIPLGSSHLNTTRYIWHVKLLHFGCVKLFKQHSSTRSKRRAQLDRHARLDELDMSNVSYQNVTWRAKCNLGLSDHFSSGCGQIVHMTSSAIRFWTIFKIFFSGII